jgi:hypothetical protein
VRGSGGNYLILANSGLTFFLLIIAVCIFFVKSRAVVLLGVFFKYQVRYVLSA